MGEGYIVRRGGIGSGGGVPEFTYSDTAPGAYEIFIEDAKNWRIEFYRSGTLTFTKLGSAAKGIDVFILGGGGAGAKSRGTEPSSEGAAPGGGGYYKTMNNIYLQEGLDFSVIIGAGATTVGENGGNSSMVGTTVNGGGAATAGEPSYIQCTMTKTTGSGVYVYTGTNVSGPVDTLPSGSSVQLASDSNGQPIPITITVGGQSVYTYRGKDGRYYRGGINSGWYVVYSASTVGVGAEQTQVFGTGDLVSGPGETENATRYGQGGGTSGIQGGNGLVVIRNSPIIINAQPTNVSVAENGNAIFTFKATGRSLTYQWQFLPTDTGAQWSDTTATGATTNQLTVQALSYRNGYKYRCVVSDGYNNQVISNEATLTIQA